MPGSAKRIETNAVGNSEQATYQMMYLAKRPSYEVRLAIPEDHPPSPGADCILVQLRFKDQHRIHDLDFHLEEFEDFYESLSQLLEYIKAEQEKHCRQL